MLSRWLRRNGFIAQGADAREGGDDVGNENCKSHFQDADAGKIAFEDGITVVDGDEHDADDDCVTERTFYNRRTGHEPQPFFH